MQPRRPAAPRQSAGPPRPASSQGQPPAPPAPSWHRSRAGFAGRCLAAGSEQCARYHMDDLAQSAASHQPGYRPAVSAAARLQNSHPEGLQPGGNKTRSFFILPPLRSSPVALLPLSPYTRLLCPAQYCSRRANFCTFPVAVLGKASTNSTVLGALKWAMWSRQNLMRSCALACWFGLSTTRAFGTSPHLVSGTPTTAASSTAGCS